MLILAIVGCLLLFALSIFQILLIIGKPLGEYAWGGQHTVLPTKLRIGSVTSIILYVFFAVVLLSKTGVLQIIPDSSFLGVITWIIAGYSLLGIAMNAISRSKKERVVMTPVVTVLAIIFTIAAF